MQPPRPQPRPGGHPDESPGPGEPALRSAARPPVAVTAVGVVVPLAAAAALGLLAKTPAWTRADLRLADLVHELRTPWLTRAAEALRVAFLPPAAIALCAAAVALLLVLRRYGDALLTTLVVAAGWTANTAYKAAIDRPRPAPERQLVPELGHGSFPSGHVAVTLALVIACCLLTAGPGRRLAVAAGALLVAAQAFARVYLGVHHPTDVVGSLLVVGAVATAVVAACGPLAARLGRAAAAGRAAGQPEGQVAAGPEPPHGS